MKACSSSLVGIEVKRGRRVPHDLGVVGMLDHDESLAQGHSCDDAPGLSLVRTAPYVLGDLVVVDDDLRVRVGQ